jgi:hypothetical protein
MSLKIAQKPHTFLIIYSHLNMADTHTFKPNPTRATLATLIFLSRSGVWLHNGHTVAIKMVFFSVWFYGGI